jgi:beta-lactam-binding protein with PASTA domain
MCFLRSVLYALILIVVGLFSAFTAMRLAIHGGEVTVPGLAGLTAADAQRVAEGVGLTISREQRFYSTDVAEGRILSQLPPAGSHVRVGFRIRIAESLGPQKVEIPNLLGQSVRSAELNLRRRGLELGSVAYLPTANAADEQIIGQTPTPDAQQVSAPAVSLLTSTAVSAQAFVMPNFVGSKLSEASAAVRAAGLAVGAISTKPVQPANPAEAGAAENGPGGPGTSKPGSQTSGRPRKADSSRASSEAVITRQTPAAGQRVLTGTIVQFEIAAAGEHISD